MNKGIIYVMTTAVSGLIKIGQTGSESYRERMRNLEANGYYNVPALKCFFAIELEGYKEKEGLLHEVFNKQRIGGSELFALDQDLVRELLLAFDGKVIYPKITDREEEFGVVSKARQQGARFNFYRKGLKNGDKVIFIDDENIVAEVANEREVEYEGQIWRLSPLTYKIFEEKKKLNSSGAYQGANYFTFNGKKLKDLPDLT